jgi:Uma2 family endonuclease
MGYGRPFIRADLAHVPDDGRRYELVDGVLIVTAPPGRLHQRVLLELAVTLHAACPPEFEVIVAPFTVGLAADTVMQPDLLVARRDKLTDRDLSGPHDLVVEVLSPTTRLIELNTKRERFERAGIPSFWVVDPVGGSARARFTAWQLGDDGRYRTIVDIVDASRFHASSPYPVTVVPGALVG